MVQMAKEEVIVARGYEGNGREIPADSVILAMGLKSRIGFGWCFETIGD